MNAPWNNEDLRRAFDADFDALVAFASRSNARVGFAFLRADGQVDLGRPLDARISARMTHVFALAQMRGIEGAAHLVDHGLAALAGPLRGPNGSWYAEVVPTSEHSATPVPRAVFSQRAQSAMIGAAAAATMVGHEGARDLLADLEADQDRRWWDPRPGAVREEIEAQAGVRSPLRRLSTNLDTAQAYLAAWEATGERVWFDRARSILRLVGEIAARCGFALPDLYDEEWRPLPASCDQAPVELIRPGDTLPGLGFKAARLIGQVYAILTHIGEKPGSWMIDTATALYDRALADGWTNEGVGGIVYTLDPAGLVAAPQRMHWVVCEAASAARVLAEVVDPSRADELAVDYARAIAWADSYARAGMGRWIHEVAPDGSVSMLVWEGRPDALTAARMLARGAAPIHLTVTGATAARYASQASQSASS
ncbi:MAG: AGE family epimerase/isomerase [Actinomyces sp.]|nr:AGE family epimerase/isomerase [Actinomyces sp.]